MLLATATARASAVRSPLVVRARLAVVSPQHLDRRHHRRGGKTTAPMAAPQEQQHTQGGGGDDEPYVLWYWPGIKGRGEYVRLVLVEAGVEWREAGAGEGGFAAVRDFCFGRQAAAGHFPIRAPPALQRGGFTVCNTPAILSYLNRALKLGPQDDESLAHVDQCLAVVTDAVAEGRLAFHPKDFYASHKTQVAESPPYVKQYGEQRLPKHLQHFEDILAQHGGTPEAPGWLVGNALTAADLALYHMVAAARQHYGAYLDQVDAPRVKAHAAAVAARPRIAAYLQSERCQPWDADSMM